MKKKYEVSGVWDNEPDEESGEYKGMKTFIKRGPVGHLCGYVGIPEGHPWFGKDYNDQVNVPKAIMERPIDVDKVGAINLLCAAGKSDDMKEGFLDIVFAIDVHGGLTYASECVPMEKPDGFWWFGFDCAHAGDLVPRSTMARSNCIYRDIEFVRQEIKSLADQLEHVTTYPRAIGE